MWTDKDSVSFVGREPDERLLGEDLRQLPASVGEPPQPLPQSAARRRVVRLGATMTGVTLVGGLALALLGLIELIASGGVAWIVVLVLGIVLAVTHWGWVHVAELTGNRIEARRQAGLDARQRQWLLEIEPYPRWEVSTDVDEDGSVTIVMVCHRPVPVGEGKFTFVTEEVTREHHSADEPAAAIAERAELLRREAAADTEEAQSYFEMARDSSEMEQMVHNAELERRAALKAASEALSERINENLRDPPLTE